MLRAWIAAESRDDAAAPKPWLVELLYSGGSDSGRARSRKHNSRWLRIFADSALRRDVTRLACYEPSNQLVKVIADGLAKSESRARRRCSCATSISRCRCGSRSFRRGRISSGSRRRTISSTSTFSRSCNAADESVRALQRHAYFVRRAYLDLLGIVADGRGARAFVADTRPDKRAKLIDDCSSARSSRTSGR